MERPVLQFIRRRYCGRFFYYPKNEPAEQLLSVMRSAGRKRRAIIERDFEVLDKIGVLYRVFDVKEVVDED